MAKMSKKKVLAEAPMTDYEKLRAENMMRNNRRLQSLGIGALVSMVRRGNNVHEGSTVTCDDAASGITQGSGSEYSPQDDEVNQPDESDDTVVKQVKELKVARRKKCAGRKKSNARTSSPASTPSSAMAPGRVMAPPPAGSRRMLQERDEDAPARVTRQKKLKEAASSLHIDGASSLHIDGASSLHMDEGSSFHKDGASSLHKDGASSLHKDGASSLHLDGGMPLYKDGGSLLHNDVVSPMHTDEGGSVHMDLSRVVTSQSLNVPGFSEQDNQPTRGGDKTALVGHKRRGVELERITKGLGKKIAIEIPEGFKRPEKPMQAAKFASECGFVARGSMPLFTHFKEYKKDAKLMENYVGKVSANFQMDTSDETIQGACKHILQKVSKNSRHKIKRDHFDNVNANEVSIKSPVDGVTDSEWQKLVQMWSTPEHKKICESAKRNREKVKFQQRTGSRCYAAHIYATREERKGKALSAVDLFKITHNSKKDGFSQDVQQAISDMERILVEPTAEGEQPKSDVAAVAEVLTKKCPSSTFLMNVGLGSSSSKKFSKSDPAILAHVTELKDSLEREQLRNEAMEQELAEMRRKNAEAEAAQAARDKEHQALLKRTEATDEKVAHLMALFGSKVL